MNLKAVIKTKDGPTRPIQIKDSIRQGGVLSVIQYATVMDEIAKEIEKRNIGVPIPNSNRRIGCLLWMDDVVLLAENEKDLQEMLTITKKTADKYHIVFGQEKSKTMNTTTKANKESKIMGEMMLEETAKYKYLGELITKRGTLIPQIEEAERKAQATLQTILTIAGDPTMKGIQMDTMWKLVETCIIPTITYGSETWEMNKKETQLSNRTLDNILKRILMLPTSTPREALYIETGILDIEHTITKNRISTHCRLEETKNELLSIIMDSNTKNSWKMKTKEMEKELALENIELETKGKQKRNIHSTIQNEFKTKLEAAANSKSKVKHLIDGKVEWTQGTREKYMTELTRTETSTIFKARTRMLDIKNNFRGKYQTMECRGCGKEDETQEHVFNQCTGIHTTEESKIKNEEIFSTDTRALRRTTVKIQSTLERLKSEVHSNAQPGDPGDLTT